ncbi:MULTISPECIES: LPS-assembly protein LptD [unclassified Campylobacter]|uniref:LPS-assembly protein LptD n=1 Tax=unclassified Campylobacter TaxID=2593542 RepID=UPI00137FC9F0|nr:MULTISPECIES: LPS-assembly protein LptD [unclassified Campylobacter]KAA8604280.1 organic solvent tolerance protein [Campylobacter sp. LR185c]
MWRKICFFFSSFVFLEAAQVDIYALSAVKEGELLIVQDDVVIFSDFYFITAKKAIYNEKTSEVELFGDVNILRGQNERSHSKYAKLKLDTNEANFEDFFFANNKMEVWFKSKESALTNDKFESRISSVSSCNVENPDWEFRFSDGYLNRESNFVHLYNARLYVKDVPILYLPYFGFSADTNRQSGLLVPKFSLNTDEGFHYEQPIYIAEYDSWDLELDPQIRTNRGYGVYSTLRFVDSLHGMGEFNAGLFREFNDYFKDENLKYQTHSGIELRYLRDNVFKYFLGDNFQEGLWFDGIYLNDIDYLTLGNRDYRDLTSLVTSKFNYFLANENDFLALYARYYIDTSTTTNKYTMQEYPSLQYHHFSNTLIDDLFNNEWINNKFLFSFDAFFHNYYRREGSYANQTNFILPISYHQALFNNYLHINFTEELYASFVNYTYDPDKKHEHFYRNTHELDFYTDLLSAYPSFFHTINFGTKYRWRGNTSGLITADYLVNEDERDYVQGYVNQYFYNDFGEKKIKHRLHVNYLTTINKFEDLTNLLTYYYNDNFRFNSEVTYSYETNHFDYVVTQFQLEFNPVYNLNFSHAYQNDEYGKYSFIGTNTNIELNKNYILFGGIWMDVQRSKANMWEAGYTYQRKCWNYSLVYRERIDPQLTSAGISAKNQSGVYFIFNFYPLGGIKYNFNTSEEENDI